MGFSIKAGDNGLNGWGQFTVIWVENRLGQGCGIG